MISFAAIATTLVLIIRTDTVSILLSNDPAAIEKLTQSNIALITLITLLLMTIQNLFTITPVILLISINVATYGLIPGFIWSLVISTIGATISFYMTRYWFQNMFKRFVPTRYTQKLEQQGFWFVLVARLIPIMPTNIINFASGMSSIRFSRFLYATIAGNTVYFLTVSLLTENVLSSVVFAIIE